MLLEAQKGLEVRDLLDIDSIVCGSDLDVDAVARTGGEFVDLIADR